MKKEADKIEERFLRWCRLHGITSKQAQIERRAAFFAGYNSRKGEEIQRAVQLQDNV